jgi:hypothetical protein
MSTCSEKRLLLLALAVGAAEEGIVEPLRSMSGRERVVEPVGAVRVIIIRSSGGICSTVQGVVLRVEGWEFEDLGFRV